MVRHYSSPYFYVGMAEEELCLATSIFEDGWLVEELYLLEGKVTWRYLYYDAEGNLTHVRTNGKLEEYNVRN